MFGVQAALRSIFKTVLEIWAKWLGSNRVIYLICFLQFKKHHLIAHPSFFIQQFICKIWLGTCT